MKKEKNISRKILRNGDIICIPIKDIGFAYAKYINVDKIFNLTFSYAEYVKFYVGIYPEKINNISQLNREVLIPPVTIVTYTVVRRLNWEIFYNESIFEEDKVISDTKKGWPPFVYYSEESQYDSWRYFRFNPNSPNKVVSNDVPYESIQHLPLEGILDAELIPIWLIVENNKYLGKKLENGLGFLGDSELFILDREKDRFCYALLNKNTRDKAL
jgi:hypothetical protein